MMTPEKPTLRPDKSRTRTLILEASEVVFGKAGIKGATTREIARAAGVNETTLFRNFSSKTALLKAVIEKNLEEARNIIYAEDWSHDLKRDLTRYAQIYTGFVKRHDPMLRVVISEMNRLPEEARRLFHATNMPMTKKLLEYLDEAKGRGQVRQDIDSLQMAHSFLNILLMSILRMGMVEIPYSHDEYVESVVELFMSGVRDSESSR